MNTYKTEGVVLKKRNFGEADRILTLFSKHFGKIQILAKGIRKTTSRKSGSLELFNQVRIFVARGKNLDIVTEAEVVNSFSSWRKDLKKIALAYYYSELVDKLTVEESPNEEVFDLLTNSFINLSQEFQDRKIFARSLLEETGFWPKGKEIDRIDLDNFIERITEKKIISRKTFKDFVY